MTDWRLKKPPRALRRAKLDNLALVPGSLLAFKEAWQKLANELPEGTTLIILPKDSSPRKTLERVSSLMQAKGRPIRTLPAERFTKPLSAPVQLALLR
jgi:hypothetical protein